MKLFAVMAIWSIAVFATFAPQAHYRKHGPALLNDLKYTPGQVRTTNTKAVCSETTPQFRNTTESMKKQVCLEYGLAPHCYGPGKAEIDHLISLEIGGADAVPNLWPQPYAGTGAHAKDQVENWLHRQVCSGKMPLAEAQKGIARDWFKLYLQMQAAQ